MCACTIFYPEKYCTNSKQNPKSNDKCFYGSGKVLVILLYPACLSISFLNDKTLTPRGSLNLTTWINLKKLTESYLLVFVVRFP